MRKNIYLLALIFIVGTFFRFYNLGEFPIGLHRDEAFLGYNAYSILKSGKDMSGQFLPLHLESFIYSPAGYVYFSIPFIFLFDLSAFSVRFASAFFGSMTIIITYFLTKELFKGKNRLIPFIASTMIAIVPWHINLSRTATENTIVVFFISLAVLLYLCWIKNSKFLLLLGSFISFAITIFVYQAPRVFLPLFIPLMIFIFVKSYKDKIKILQQIILYSIFVIIPLFFILSSKDLSLRIRTVSIFATDQTQLVLDEQIRGDGVANVSNSLARTFHNKLIGYSSAFLQNYFKHFTYDFLFTDNSFPARYKVPLFGILYILDLPLIILGVLYLLKNEKKVGTFLIGWLLIVPIGSGLTFDDIPNMQRTLIAFPALSVISAFGLFTIISYLSKQHLLTKAFIASFTIFAAFNITFYLHQYYIHSNTYRPWIRQDGYKELVNQVNNLLPNYKKVVITNRESAPTIFVLFYNKFNPEIFQKETKESTMRDFDRINFGKYEISQEECPLRLIKDESGFKLTGEKGVIYVNSGLCEESENGTKTLNVVKRSDGSIAFKLLVLDK